MRIAFYLTPFIFFNILNPAHAFSKFGDTVIIEVKTLIVDSFFLTDWKTYDVENKYLILAELISDTNNLELEYSNRLVLTAFIQANKFTIKENAQYRMKIAVQKNPEPCVERRFFKNRNKDFFVKRKL